MNEQQKIALEPSNSIWVNASAGSGKTTILVNRFLKLLLNGVDLSKILCITYTNAGAVEMRDRINEKLARWAIIDDEDLKKELETINEFGDKIKIVRTLFAKVLDYGSDLKILTIHSLCQQIISRFSIEANVIPNFSILNDIKKEEILDEIKKKIYADNSVKDEIEFIFKYKNEEQFLELLDEFLNIKDKLLFIKNNFGED
ncbi:MAG: UvrD-helicase domain-containing protein, partial [Rickettsiales bacterium]|nr:UvrD-helicase domain-containing protein [Rickettsiales bacterium]